jgi:N-alpha-acetyltransferase 30
VKRVIAEMRSRGCEEVVLEAEATNLGALKLYGNLGFIRDKRLQRYYLNGNDAYRLKLLLPRLAEHNIDEKLEIQEAAHQLNDLKLGAT